ncbi:MAG: hypothetical protein MZW92_38425 [Comamonadaceae bacterium]|nr:hypothetical protein [Comamonadaceae bacterium]
MICLILAHPYPSRSRANAASWPRPCGRSARSLDLRSLYDLYPDFDIDVAAEQGCAAARRGSSSGCTRCYWYSGAGPAQALVRPGARRQGWAFGEGGDALARQALPVGRHHRRRRAGLCRASGVHGQPFEPFRRAAAQHGVASAACSGCRPSSCMAPHRHRRSGSAAAARSYCWTHRTVGRSAALRRRRGACQR